MTPSTASTASAPAWAGALSGLAQRILGPTAQAVTFHALEADRRRFAYQAEGGRLRVFGTDASAAAVGLHTYLRQRCGVAVSWDDLRPQTPEELPAAGYAEGEARVNEVYYLNFCTFSYTTAWWGWDDWEREIDWMALHGVTTPLMAVGHEAVIERVLLDRGLDREATHRFLSGPAYLPWFIMGCLEGFAGPLPTGWIDRHRELAGRILRRQRELGMHPVLPAFTGHVPAELADRGGERDWQGHRTRVIGPENPLFVELAADMVRVQQEMWGTDHRYAADPFIEMVPVDDDPEYPGRVADALLRGLRDADPQAVWYLQTWPFSYQSDFWTQDRVRTFLSSFPDGGVALLDLWAEAEPQWRRFANFSGREWYWCALLNFGGRSDPLGDLPGLSDEIDSALASSGPPAGIGLSMEATRTAPVYFERALDLAWRHTPLEEWVTGWVTRRYQIENGAAAERAVRAWQGLTRTVLSSGDYRIFPEDFTGLLTMRPVGEVSAVVEGLRAEVPTLLWYEPAELIDAWESLISFAEMKPERVSGPLGRDLIEMALAILPRAAELSLLNTFDAAQQGGRPAAGMIEEFLRIFDDLDQLLATRPEFRYDTWEQAAVAWAQDEEGERILADNARRIVTVWGEAGDGFLDDYSARLWAGMMGYYRDRWRLWSQLHDDPDRLEEALCGREERFLREGASSPPVTEDVVAVSRTLFDRYAEPFLYAADALRRAQDDERKAR